MKLLPSSWMPYAKAWVALLGFVIAAVVVAWPEIPKWVTVISAALTSVGVYFAKNVDNDTDDEQPVEHLG